VHANAHERYSAWLTLPLNHGGIAQYDAKRRASPDPDVRSLLEASAARAGLLSRVFGGKPPALRPVDIIEIIFFPVVNEGCRVVSCCDHVRTPSITHGPVHGQLLRQCEWFAACVH
jgi:hypothetical protein